MDQFIRHDAGDLSPRQLDSPAQCALELGDAALAHGNQPVGPVAQFVDRHVPKIRAIIEFHPHIPRRIPR